MLHEATGIWIEGSYLHFKGGRYTVDRIVRSSETQEDMVVYYNADDTSKWWVRSAACFTAHLERGNYNGPRFIHCP